MANWKLKGYGITGNGTGSLYGTFSYTVSKLFIRIPFTLISPPFVYASGLFQLNNNTGTGCKFHCYNNSYGPDAVYYFWFYFYTFSTTIQRPHPAGFYVKGNPGMGRIVLTVIWDGATLATYWSGARILYEPCSGEFVATNKELTILSYDGGYYTWPGVVDDVIISIGDNAIPEALQDFPLTYDELFLTADDFCTYYDYSPEHKWTFENPFNLGEDTGAAGGWHLFSRNTVSQTQPLLGEFVEELPLSVFVWLDCDYSPAQKDIGNFLFHSQVGGGIPPYIYGWQVSYNRGITWRNIISDKDLLLENVGAPAEVWVRCIITDNNNNTATSSIVKVAVYSVEVIQIPYIAHEGIQVRIK